VDEEPDQPDGRDRQPAKTAAPLAVGRSEDGEEAHGRGRQRLRRGIVPVPIAARTRRHGRQHTGLGSPVAVTAAIGDG
jgi:hypothetical protein